jgi:tRNA A37 methylthiotransferase MiaB
MELVDLVNSQTRELSSTYLGKEVEILCEDYDAKKGMYLGRDEYGRMGYFKSEQNLIGQFVIIKINQANGVSLYGDVV